MVVENIVGIVVIALLVIFLWGIFAKAIKLLFYVGIAIFILLAINSFFIYQDLMDLKKNFASEPKQVLLVDDNRVLTGLIIDGQDIDVLENSDLNSLAEYIEDQNYEGALGENYKLMVFDISIVENMGEKEILGQALNQDEIRETFETGTSEEKASLFSVLLAEDILSQKNPLFFFSEYKDGNIVVYPETAIFKTVKFIPLDLFKGAAETILEKSVDKIDMLKNDDAEQ
jgi:hypothetical protein